MHPWRRRAAAVAAGLGAALALTPRTGAATAQTPAQAWLTSADHARVMAPAPLAPPSPDGATVVVDSARRFQRIDGFGFTLTGGSAQLLARMSAPARRSLLRTLFGRGPGELGVSWLRVSIGASDMDGRVFTYDDLPPGATDPSLARSPSGPTRRRSSRCCGRSWPSAPACPSSPRPGRRPRG